MSQPEKNCDKWAEQTLEKIAALKKQWENKNTSKEFVLKVSEELEKGPFNLKSGNPI